MNLISKLNARRMALANKKRKGFTMVEMVIVIVIISVLAAVLIPTYASVVQNARTSSASQSMKTSYEAIKAYDLYDNGYLDSAANGVIVYKAPDTTKGYYAIVKDGEMGDVYIMEQLGKSAVAWELMGETLPTFSADQEEATSTINSTDSADNVVVTFTWNTNGFDIKGVGQVVSTVNADEIDVDLEDGGAVMNMEFEDVTDNVCFYSIGEGSVEAAVGTAIPG